MSSYFYTINIPIINSTICIPELLFINFYYIFILYFTDSCIIDNSLNVTLTIYNISIINNYLFEVNTYLVIPL